MPSPRAHLTLVFALAAGPAFATVVMALSLDELVARAPLIVRGTVQRSVTSWDDAHRGIWTWTELTVREPLKGRAPATVLVKQPGGVVDGVGQSVAGAARFEPSEDVVLFLEPAVDEKGAFVLMGLSFGKVTLTSGPGATVAQRNLKGLTLARPGRAGLVGPIAEHETLGTADAFLARVRRLATPGGAQ
ncbi:MAG: hypothetical protein INH41_02650 [Myxococcaceae bacterium]|jgi:hypothetical protein|nr:hypothetical protein [Myxococcaceae bacterium]MCA3011278.1 hypothetical protein [Myxococcaceae bacterium]